MSVGLPVVKSLLLLMLLAGQLLSRNAISFYLCLANDGSFCCVSTSPSCGDSCQTPSCSSHDACGHADAGSQLSCPLAGRDEGGKLPVRCLSNYLVSAESSECTHIPVLTTDAQASNAVRSPITVNVRLIASLVSQASIVSAEHPSISLLLAHCCRNSAARSFSLIVVSTVVVRC